MYAWPIGLPVDVGVVYLGGPVGVGVVYWMNLLVWAWFIGSPVGVGMVYWVTC